MGHDDVPGPRFERLALDGERRLALERDEDLRIRMTMQGVVSNLGNPKIALFFASLLPQFAPGGHAGFAGFLALGLLFCAMTLAWLSLYAVTVHRLRAVLGGPVRRVLDAVTGLVLVALGIRVAAAER
jgi:threonine/homoserine/homoserine lactone efflux protein